MKITKSQLKQIIKEELSQVLAEFNGHTPATLAQTQRDLTLAPGQKIKVGATLEFQTSNSTRQV